MTLTHRSFLDEDFLLYNETARRLFFEYAQSLPILDYHGHLPPHQIADNHNFGNLSEIWLHGDHYKWRAMRTHGIHESYCTGDQPDLEKFRKWAKTVPYTMRNPLYHWTHMELRDPFGIHQILSEDTADDIYHEASALLQTPEFSTQSLLNRWQVEVICTTDDPTDSLEPHRKMQASGAALRMYPTFRPDKAMMVHEPESFNAWADKLSSVSQINISSWQDYLSALRQRHDEFGALGCSSSDHGLDVMPADDFTESEVATIFAKIRSGNTLTAQEQGKFRSAVMYHIATWNHEKGWVQLFHLGALRNNSTRMARLLGADTGWDAMGDFEHGRALVRFLDRLDQEDKLAKTMLFNVNPRDNELFATIAVTFNDGSVAGKVQFGPAWWFLDQKEGIEKQLNALSNIGLLSYFVGMVTDSRSFLSFSRHEYFRRVLCNLIGQDVENGELPNDPKWLGHLIERICYTNACDYFKF